MLLLLPRVLTEIAFSIIWSAFDQQTFAKTPTAAPRKLQPSRERQIAV